LVTGRAWLLFCLLLAVPVGAKGAVSSMEASWGAPTVLGRATADTGARLPVVVRDGHRNATAAWEVFSGSGYLGATADRHAGRGWTAPRQLAGGVALQLAGDPRGDLLAVWTDVTGTSQRIRAQYRPAGDRWRAPVFVSPAGRAASIPQAALDAHGKALVVWTAYTSGSVTAEAASRRPTGRWSHPVVIARGISGNAAMAMNASGRALVAWADQQTETIRIASRSPGGNWTRPTTLSSPHHDALNPRVALNAAGTAVVVWMGTPAARSPFSLEAAIRPAGGRFGFARAIAGEITGLSSVALAANGEAVVLSANGAGLYSNVRPPHGRFGSRDLLATDGFAPTVGVDARGNAIALWTRSDGTNVFVHAARQIPGHSFGAGVDLAPAGPDCFQHRCLVGGEKALVVSPAGSATAVWIVQPQPQHGLGSYIEAAEYGAP
jgi:hypothetical protein